MGARRPDVAAAYRTGKRRRSESRSRSRICGVQCGVTGAALAGPSPNKTIDLKPFADSLSFRLEFQNRKTTMGSIVLLDLMGGVALLLWGLHMVHSGILRAFGPDLRRYLSRALGNRFSAFAAGLGL